MVGNRLVGLEALRGIAALVVVFGHAASISGTKMFYIRMHLAVDLFFILSGYVMARSYEPRMAAGKSAPAFLWARLKRIWPTMAIGAAVGALSYSHYHPALATLELFLMALFFIPMITPPSMAFPVNPPAWSVMFELLANVAHAFALRRMSNLQIGALIAVCAGLLMAFQTWPNPGVNHVGFALGLPRVLACYGIGVILWRVMQDRAVLPVWIGLTVFPLVIVISHFIPPDVLWFDWVFMFAVAPLLLLSGLGEPPLQKLFVFLGAVSFPLYAVHGPVQEYVRKTHGGGMTAVMIAGLGAGVAFYLALKARPRIMDMLRPEKTLVPAE